MARRRSSGITPLQIGIGAGVILAAGGLVLAFNRGGEDKKNGQRSFSPMAYRDSAFGMRGSTLSLTGTVREMIEFGTDSTRVFEVEVAEDGRSEVWQVPVVVPPTLRSEDIQVGQAYRMTVTVDIDARVIASDIAPL